MERTHSRHTLTTLLELAKTDEGREKIRVMVAEALGWKFNVRDEDDLWWTTRPSGGGSGMKSKLTYDKVFGIFKVPNYPRDLNACAEFEAGLTEPEKERYKNWLHEVCGVRIWGAFEAISASAMHRCMAFILTKGAVRE